MRERILLFVLLALAFIIRLVLINQSFWMDEAAQALESMRPFSEQLDIAYDFQPPLYHLVVHVFTYVSTDEWWLRMTSVLSGLVMIWATYELGTYVFGKTRKTRAMRFFAPLMMTFSSLHVYFSQELRQYLLAAMIGTLSWLVLLRIGENKQYSQQKHRWILFTFLTIAGLYTMYLYPFLVFSQVLYIYFIKRELLKKFVRWMGLAILSYLPWMPSFMEQLKIGTTLQGTLVGWSEVVSLPQWKAVPLIFLKFLGGVELIDASVFDLFYFGVPLAAIAYLAFRVLRFSRKDQSAMATYMIWIGATILSAWAVSFFVPVITVKRVLFCLPAFYLLLGKAIEGTGAGVRQYFMLGFLVLNVVGLSRYWNDPLLQREDWRGLHQEVHAAYSREHTVVIFGFSEPFASWRYYDLQESHPLDTIAFGQIPIDSSMMFETRMQEALKYNKILVLDYLRDLTDSSRRIESFLDQQGYVQTSLHDRPGIGFVRVFERSMPLARGVLHLEPTVVLPVNQVQYE